MSWGILREEGLEGEDPMLCFGRVQFANVCSRALDMKSTVGIILKAINMSIALEAIGVDEITEAEYRLGTL